MFKTTLPKKLSIALVINSDEMQKRARRIGRSGVHRIVERWEGWGCRGIMNRVMDRSVKIRWGIVGI